jgi:site-specific DNA-adenine methylase
MAKTSTSYKTGHKKKGGRKKGIPNKVTKEAKELFNRIIGFINDEDLYNFYNRLKKSPHLFISFLKLVAPKDLSIKLNHELKANIDMLHGASKEDRDIIIKILEKYNDTNNE